MMNNNYFIFILYNKKNNTVEYDDYEIISLSIITGINTSLHHLVV